MDDPKRVDVAVELFEKILRLDPSRDDVRDLLHQAEDSKVSLRPQRVIA